VGRLERHVHVRGSLHPATLHIAIAGVIEKTHSCVEHHFLDLTKTQRLVRGWRLDISVDCELVALTLIN